MGLYSDLYESFGYLCGIQLIAHINLVASQVAQWEESAKQEMWVGSTSESGRSPGEENGNQLQYSCLGNPMDRGTWWGHKELHATECLNNNNKNNNNSSINLVRADVLKA